jgi:hypothetical protein
MIPFIVIGIVVAPLLLASVAFLLGFRVGGDHWQSELTRVRVEAVEAERRLHDLSRQAFIAMAEKVEQEHRRRAEG